MVKDIDLKDLTDVDYIHQLLDRLNHENDQYILKENGTPRAALLSLDDFKRLEQAKADKEKAWQDLFATLDKVHALNPNVSEKEVHADVAAAIRAIRRERRSPSQ